jgi:hypothetical protein
MTARLIRPRHNFGSNVCRPSGTVPTIIASIDRKEEEENARRPRFPETCDTIALRADFSRTRPDTIIRLGNAVAITILATGTIASESVRDVWFAR